MRNILIIISLFFFSYSLSGQTDEGYISYKSFESRYANFKQGIAINGGVSLGVGNYKEFGSLMTNYMVQSKKIDPEEVTAHNSVTVISLDLCISKRIKNFEIGIPLEFNFLNASGSDNKSGYQSDHYPINMKQIGTGIDLKVHQSIRKSGKSTIYFGYCFGLLHASILDQQQFVIKNKVELGLSFNNNKFNTRPFISYYYSPMKNALSLYGESYNLSQWCVAIGVRLGFVIKNK
jgi:hypothetical protein